MKLHKNLGVFSLFSFAAGSMISSGLFVLPAIAYAEAKTGAIISYILAAILMLPSVYSKAELSTAMTRSGGTYFYAERILGTPAGILAGFANWFSIALKSSFALIGIGAFATLIFPDLTYNHIKMIAAGACIFFTIVNLVSVKSSGSFQVILVMFLLAILGVYVIFGYRVTDFHVFSTIKSGSMNSILEATGLVFISYGGLTKIASIAEESKNAGKSIPKAMMMAYLLVSVLYILVVGITFGVLKPEQITNTLTPISDAAGIFLGKAGKIVLSVGAILAFVTTANAGILAASRVPMAMSRDKLLPGMFGFVSKKHKTPTISIFFTSVFMVIVILFLKVEVLAKVASTFMILLFIMVNFSVIVVRYSKIRNYKPTFKSPMFPWIQIFAIFTYSILIFQMGFVPLSVTLGFILFCYFWYRIYAVKTDRNKSALVKLVKMVMNKSLVNTSNYEALESELLDILKDRDEIIEDRFDGLLKDAKIIDLPKANELSEFFELISEELSTEFNLPVDKLHKDFCEREKMSNTNITDHIAIPHIILEGTEQFGIALVRNKAGINWTEGNSPVNAVFVLAGSMDQRDFHLKSLMAIAQIVQRQDFLKKWMSLKDAESLRTFLLLSKRSREKRK